MGCIYLATNRITGKRYVGKTRVSFQRRIWEHKNESANGSDRYFHRALRKYGFDAFVWERLYRGKDENQLVYWECYYIKMLKTKSPNGYNLTDGGDGVHGRTGWHHLEATKVKIRMGNVGKKHPTAGAKIRERHKGKIRGPRPESVKAKISASHIGMFPSDEARAKMRAIHKLNVLKYPRDHLGRFMPWKRKRERL